MRNNNELEREEVVVRDLLNKVFSFIFYSRLTKLKLNFFLTTREKTNATYMFSQLNYRTNFFLPSFLPS